MRWSPLLLVLLMVAGCAEEAGPTAEGSTAKVADRLGRSIATSWAADARLAGIFGYEPADLDEVREEYPNATVPPEDRHGDGRAVVWGMNYTSASRGETLFLILDGMGNELDREIMPGATQPLPAWRVDSVAAASVLHREVEGFSQRMANLTDLFYGIEMDGNISTWFFLEFSQEVLCFHAVGTQNGTLWESECLDFDLAFELAEQGSWTGRLTALAPAAATTFVLQGDHRGLLVVFREPSGPPVGSVTLTVTAPDGRVEEASMAPDLLAGGQAELRFAATEAGDYGLEIGLDGGVLADFEVYYCTSGIQLTYNFAGLCIYTDGGSQSSGKVPQRIARTLGLDDPTGKQHAMGTQFEGLADVLARLHAGTA